MPKLQAAKTRSVLDELSKFANQQAVVDAIERAGKDRALLRKAKKDARAYLRGEGLELPPRAELTISEQRIAVGAIRVCLTVCRASGPIIVCVRVCIRIVIVIG
jgi:hypothetical protein